MTPRTGNNLAVEASSGKSFKRSRLNSGFRKSSGEQRWTRNSLQSSINSSGEAKVNKSFGSSERNFVQGSTMDNGIKFSTKKKIASSLLKEVTVDEKPDKPRNYS